MKEFPALHDSVFKLHFSYLLLLHLVCFLILSYSLLCHLVSVMGLLFALILAQTLEDNVLCSLLGSPQLCVNTAAKCGCISLLVGVLNPVN